jgi:DNA-binding transcriptional ArsR family regulator
VDRIGRGAHDAAGSHGYRVRLVGTGAETDSDGWLDERAGPVVRPYVRTPRRTRPVTHRLDVGSLITATRCHTGVDIDSKPEYFTIIGLCRYPLSVAELAAHLDLPLGTVRVLLGDLLDAGLVESHVPVADTPDDGERLCEAVIDGLRRL